MKATEKNTLTATVTTTVGTVDTNAVKAICDKLVSVDINGAYRLIREFNSRINDDTEKVQKTTYLYKGISKVNGKDDGFSVTNVVANVGEMEFTLSFGTKVKISVTFDKNGCSINNIRDLSAYSDACKKALEDSYEIAKQYLLNKGIENLNYQKKIEEIRHILIKRFATALVKSGQNLEDYLKTEKSA